MNTLAYPNRTDFYSNNEFPAFEGGGTVEETRVQPHTEVEGKSLKKDSGSQEREQQLEVLMTNIKAFIRSIDISKL